MDTTVCPNPDVLADYVLGRVSEADLTGIASHVETCPACQSQLETLDGLSDTVVTCLRHAAAPDEAGSEDSLLDEVLCRDRVDHLGVRLGFARSRPTKRSFPCKLASTGSSKSWARAAWGPSTRLSTPS